MSTDVVVLPTPDHKPFTVLLGAKVRGRMAEMGYNQHDLGEVLGVSQQSASNRLRGKTPFDVNELATVASWLGLTVIQLIGDAGSTPPNGGPGKIAGTVSDTARRLISRHLRPASLTLASAA